MHDPTDTGGSPIMPPANDYVTKDLFEERHRWTEKWLKDLTEGFSELRNEARDITKKLDLLLSIEKKEAKTNEANRKAFLALVGKLLGSGGAGAAILYAIQKTLGG
jgi:hypothetical protein